MLCRFLAVSFALAVPGRAQSRITPIETPVPSLESTAGDLPPPSAPEAVDTLPSLSAAPAPLSEQPSLVRRTWDRLVRYVNPPVVEPPRGADAPPSYYHGTSWSDLIAIVRSGGALKAGVTYLSDSGGVSWSYARSRARGTGSKGVLLQFPKEAVEGKAGPGMGANPKIVLSGAPPTFDRRGGIPPMVFYYNARQDIPLSRLTPASKESLRREAAAADDPGFLRQLERALNYP
jgi:hypothetical protein